MPVDRLFDGEEKLHAITEQAAAHVEGAHHAEKDSLNASLEKHDGGIQVA